MKKSLLAILIFICFSDIYPNNPIIEKCYKGVTHFNNFQLDLAIEYYQSLVSEYPNSAYPLHFLSKAYSLKYIYSLDSNDIQNFNSYSKQFMELSKTRTDEIFTEYLIAESYFLKALIYFEEGKTLDALLAVKNSNDFFNNVIKKDSLYFDAYFGKGMLMFTLGQLPDALNWGLSIMGLKGDSNKGLELIKKASGNGIFNKIEAKFNSAIITRENKLDYKESLKILYELNKKYPENELFRINIAENYFELGEYKKTIQFLSSEEISSSKYKKLISSVSLIKGEAYYFLEEFTNSISEFKKFISNTNNNNYLGIANFRIAASHYFLGNKEKAFEYLRKSDLGNSDLDEDYYAKIISKRIIDSKFNPIEFQILLADLKINNRKFNEAKSILYTALYFSKRNEIKNEINLKLAVSEYYLNKKNSSYEICKLIENTENNNLQLSETYFLMASIKFDSLKYKESDSLIKLGKNYPIHIRKKKLKSLFNSLELKISQL